MRITKVVVLQKYNDHSLKNAIYRANEMIKLVEKKKTPNEGAVRNEDSIKRLKKDTLLTHAFV